MKRFLFILTITIKSLLVDAQTWHKLSGLPENVPISQIEVGTNDTVYVLTGDDYVFYSQDSGMHWKRFSPPPFLSYLQNVNVMQLNKSNNRLFFGTTFSGISYTSNKGVSWGQEFFSTTVPSGLHEMVGNIACEGNTVVVSGDFDFSSATQRYFYSTNNGNNWSTPTLGFGIAEDILLDNNSWLVATSLGIQKTTTQGASWNVVGFNNRRTHAIEKTTAGVYYVVIEDSLVNTTFHIYQSTNLSNWTWADSLCNIHFTSMSYAPSLNALLLSTKEGLYRYSIGSNSTSSIAFGIINDAEEYPQKNAILYGTDEKAGVQRGKAPNFSNWLSFSSGLSTTLSFVTDRMQLLDSAIFSISNLSRITNKMNNLSLYTPHWSSSFANDPTNTLSSTGHQFLSITSNKNVFVGGVKNIYKSIDKGNTWTSITKPNVIAANNANNYMFDYFNAASNDMLFLTQQNDSTKLRLSMNYGNTWQEILSQNKMAAIGITSPLKITNAISDSAGQIYVSVSMLNLSVKILSSVDTGKTWTNITPTNANVLVSDFNLILDKNHALYIVDKSKIYPFGNTLSALAVPWNVNSSDVTGIELVFDKQNNIWANVVGTQSCADCGVYKKTTASWQGFQTPNIMTPYTPIRQLCLFNDSIPIVKTTFAFNEAPVGTMGIYYLSYAPIISDISTPLIHEMNVSLYPNPTSGLINIVGNKLQTISISNALGQKVSAAQHINHNSASIDLSAMPTGLYFVLIQDISGNKRTYKVIKE